MSWKNLDVIIIVPNCKLSTSGCASTYMKAFWFEEDSPYKEYDINYERFNQNYYDH